MRQKVKPSLSLIAVVGPTASGKSALAVALARRFGGEVVSCDSRQVYRGFDIGSGKITRREMRGVPHHLLDVADPRRTFTVAQYQRLARRTIADIWRRSKLPILCGGTGFYLEAVLRGTTMPQVKPNVELRHQLEKESTAELLRLLRARALARARTIDPHNRRRLVRALEIVAALGRVPKTEQQPIPARVLVIGVSKSKRQLQRLIKTRLEKRRRQGLVREVKRLHAGGLSWRKIESFGLEYRAVARYLEGKLTPRELTETILRESWQYARRQMTWLRKMRHVQWVHRNRDVARLVSSFVKK